MILWLLGQIKMRLMQFLEKITTERKFQPIIIILECVEFKWFFKHCTGNVNKYLDNHYKLGSANEREIVENVFSKWVSD